MSKQWNREGRGISLVQAPLLIIIILLSSCTGQTPIHQFPRCFSHILPRSNRVGTLLLLDIIIESSYHVVLQFTPLHRHLIFRCLCSTHSFNSNYYPFPIKPYLQLAKMCLQSHPHFWHRRIQLLPLTSKPIIPLFNWTYIWRDQWIIMFKSIMI